MSAAKTEIMCLRTKRMPESTSIFSVEVAGHVQNQTNEFVYLRGNVGLNAYLSIEIHQRMRNVWSSFRKYTLEMHDRPSAPLELKIQMLKAEVIETMMYGCVTQSQPTHTCYYDTLRRDYHSLLTRCIGWKKNNHTDNLIYYFDTLIKTGSDSIETTVHRRRILLVGFVARMEDTRLSKYVMFGELVGGAGCAGGQEKERMGCFLDDLKAFGINTDQWTAAVQDEREWRRTVDKRRNVSWRNVSLQRKPGLDYSIQ